MCDGHYGLSWSDGRVVCNQLGYPTNSKIWSVYNVVLIITLIVDITVYNNGEFGDGTGPVLIDYVQCDGSESSLVNCAYYTGNNCLRGDVGVGCYGKYN